MAFDPVADAFLGLHPLDEMDPGKVSITLLYEYLGSDTWRLTGSVEVDDEPVWEEITGVELTHSQMTATGSYFIFGSLEGDDDNDPFSNITNITPGSFSGPIPEPATALLLLAGATLMWRRPQRRAD